MAITSKCFGQFPLKAINKEIDFNTDTIKLALYTSGYTPDQDVHDYFNDVTNEVATAGGYVAGGKTVTNCTMTYTAGTNVVKMDADDVTWSASTITARGAVLYADTGNTSTSALIAYTDFGEDKISSSGDFTVTWDANGIVTFTVA